VREGGAPVCRIPLGLAHPRVPLAFNSLLKEYAGAQIGGKFIYV